MSIDMFTILGYYTSSPTSHLLHSLYNIIPDKHNIVQRVQQLWRWATVVMIASSSFNFEQPVPKIGAKI